MKLPILKPKEALSILQRAGFIIDHQSGSHITLYNSSTKKRVTLPYHVKDLKRGILISIIKQSGLSREEFLKFR